jgi:Glu-tRNA(Gln) amidotransferase subunit E-like FAD-binding protein
MDLNEFFSMLRTNIEDRREIMERHVLTLREIISENHEEWYSLIEFIDDFITRYNDLLDSIRKKKEKVEELQKKFKELEDEFKEKKKTENALIAREMVKKVEELVIARVLPNLHVQYNIWTLREMLEFLDTCNHNDVKAEKEEWEKLKKLLEWKDGDLHKMNQLRLFRNVCAHPDISDDKIQSALKNLPNYINIEDMNRFFIMYQMLNAN